jgi:PAS domain S-box-containing protein
MENQRNTEKRLHAIKSTFENNQDLSYKVFNHMPIGICLTNPEGYFTDVNATYCDIYGYTREELIGNNFTMVVPTESQLRLVNLHDQFLEKKFELQGKWQVVGKNKQVFDIITNAAFLYDSTGTEERKMTLVVRADKMEETIDQLQTTIDILERKIETQDIANRLAEHDMRNRLSSMVSISDILSKSEMTEKQRQWVIMLKNIGNDTLRLLSSSKDFVKMERGTYEPEVSRFDLVASVANQTIELRDLIESKQLEIEMIDAAGSHLEPAEDELFIKADKFYLEHLFHNLLKNALEASPNDQSIIIELSVNQNILAKISNKGMIPEILRENFFEKYTTSGKERGTGLGAYIAKLITEVHDGNISFTSSKEEGTSIIVEIPIIK